MKIIYCRVAPSLGALEADHKDVWGTFDYIPGAINSPTVFFGLYDLRDYIALNRHKGKKWVLWAGSDLENLKHGFIFNDGKLRLLSVLFKGFFTRWVVKVLRTAEHYVENIDEQEKLDRFGIPSKIVPSFLGHISDFPVKFVAQERPQVYISGHKNREKEYGFEYIVEVAEQVRECDFHVYGAEPDPGAYPDNIIWHGRVSKQQFNDEIKDYHCGLRLNKSDGFSEITAKSIIMGQYPITFLENAMIPNFKNTEELVSLLKSLKELEKPNWIGRQYYISVLNKYPWVHRTLK